MFSQLAPQMIIIYNRKKSQILPCGLSKVQHLELQLSRVHRGTLDLLPLRSCASEPFGQPHPQLILPASPLPPRPRFSLLSYKEVTKVAMSEEVCPRNGVNEHTGALSHAVLQVRSPRRSQQLCSGKEGVTKILIFIIKPMKTDT